MADNYMEIPELTIKQKSNFWAKVKKKNDQQSCWEWVGFSSPKDGYGKFSLEKKTFVASRVSFFLNTNIDPKEKIVCHKCDNPICVNPAHLFLGTVMDNVADKIKKNRDRYAKGEQSGPSKLSESDVLNISKLFSEGVLGKDIANMYEVSTQCVMAIVKRKTWGHLFPDDKKVNKNYVLGSNHRRTKLTEEIVKKIRGEQNISQVNIAKKYGVTNAIVHSIVHRRTWKHI